MSSLIYVWVDRDDGSHSGIMSEESRRQEWA